MKLDLKTAITVVTFVVTMAGFYYTTQHRLAALEEDVVTVQKKIKNMKRARKK